MANFGPHTTQNTIQANTWLLLGRRIPPELRLSETEALRLYVSNAYVQVFQEVRGFPTKVYPAYTLDESVLDFSDLTILTTEDQAAYSACLRIHDVAWNDGTDFQPLRLTDRAWLETAHHGDSASDLDYYAIDGLTLVVGPPFNDTVVAGSSTSNLRVTVDMLPATPSLDATGDSASPVVSGWDSLFSRYAAYLILEAASGGVYAMPASLARQLRQFKLHLAQQRSQIHRISQSDLLPWPQDYRGRLRF